MKTKEAIEFLEDLREDYSEVEGNIGIVCDFKEVISLLQELEKYRLILKDLNRQYGHYLIGVKDNGEIGIGYTIRDFIEKVEQKYFIKGD